MWFIIAGVVEIAVFGGACRVSRRLTRQSLSMPTVVRYSDDDSPAAGHTTTAATQAA